MTTESPDPSRPRRRRHRGSSGRTDSGDERTARQGDFRPTQLPFTTAMRAREVATPTPEDLADAADDLVLVRRRYVPSSPIDRTRSDPDAD